MSKGRHFVIITALSLVILFFISVWKDNVAYSLGMTMVPWAIALLVLRGFERPVFAYITLLVVAPLAVSQEAQADYTLMKTALVEGCVGSPELAQVDASNRNAFCDCVGHIGQKIALKYVVIAKLQFEEPVMKAVGAEINERAAQCRWKLN